MKTLYLMRHAQADWLTSLMDKDRPLNPLGQKEVNNLSNFAKKLPIDIALVSSARRTRDSFHLLDIDVPHIHLDILYLATAETLLAEARGRSEEGILIVGHNPGIAEFANALLKTPSDDDRINTFNPATFVIIEFEEEIAFKAGMLKKIKSGS